MNALTILALTGLCAATWSAPSCTRRAPTAAEAHPEPAQAAAEAHPEPARAGGAAEAEPASDLDRPVAELFATPCEHEPQAYLCDECRYEVGVVRVAPRLLAEGLVQTATVTKRRLAVPLALTGDVRLDERRVSHVASPVAGIIVQAHVAVGERVEAGAALVALDSVALGEAEAAYLEAAGLARLERRAFERLRALRAEAVASEKEYRAALQTAEAAALRAETARGTLLRLGLAPADVAALTPRTARGRLVLRAGAAGTVLRMHAVPGEVAEAAETLLTVGDASTVAVFADVYERDLAAVARAQNAGPLPATVAVDAYPGERFAGTVDLVSPALDEATRTVKLRVVVANPAGRLLAGMFADVTLPLPGVAGAVSVPEAAVLDDAGRSFVFVHHAGADFVRRPVTLGRAAGGFVEVVSGLEAGTTVVTEGAFLLKSDVLRAQMGAGCAD